MRFVEKYPSLDDFMAMVSDASDTIEVSWRRIEHEFLREKPIERKKTEEATLCDLEKALNQLLMAVNPLKDEMLDCATCEIRGWCAVAMAKLDAIGTPKAD